MFFKVVDKVKWNDHVWDKLFDLVSDFKIEYNFRVRDLGHIDKNTYYFSTEGFTIYFEVNSQGSWLTFEANTSKADFDEKYDFVFKRIAD